MINNNLICSIIDSYLSTICNLKNMDYNSLDKILTNISASMQNLRSLLHDKLVIDIGDIYSKYSINKTVIEDFISDVLNKLDNPISEYNMIILERVTLFESLLYKPYNVEFNIDNHIKLLTITRDYLISLNFLKTMINILKSYI